MEKKFNYVYVTTNIITGKQYVGDHSTNYLEKDTYLGSGKRFYNSIKKHGRENFKKEILEFFSTKQEAFDAQEKYIKEYNTISPNGYNIHKNGGFAFISEEGLERLSKFHEGKQLSEEHKKHISKGLQGHIVSQKTREKIGLVHKNKTVSQETRDKIGNFFKDKSYETIYGEKSSQLKKQNMSESMKTWHETIGFSEDSKQKMSDSLIGKEKTNEHKTHLSEAFTGRIYKRVKCAHCNKDIAINVYSRHHGEKCI